MYTAGVLKFGPKENPLEAMAFHFTEKFRRGELEGDISLEIHKLCEALRKQTSIPEAQR